MQDNNKEYELQLKKEFKEFKSDLDSYKKSTDEFIDSSIKLINTLYLDYEINQPKFLLKHLQLMSLELLNFVKNVCKKHDISWWMDFGNLLGAVRHGGFVPWDEDMDIGMMREDYMHFDDIISQEIKEQGLEDYIEVRYRPFIPQAPKFIQVFIRHEIQLRDFKVILGNVDIFPYDYINDFDESTIEDEFRDAKKQFIYHKEKYFNVKFAFDKYYENLNLSWKPTDNIVHGWEGPCSPDDLYNFAVFKTDKIFPLKEIEFAGNTYPCPNDVNFHLNNIYSNYMEIPKNLRKHDRVREFRYNKDNVEVFTKCYHDLKKANENFKY